MTTLDTCQPGDDMPPDDDGPGLCVDRAPVDFTLVCTRAPHALGQHVACGPLGLGSRRRVLAVWDDGYPVRIWNGSWR